MPEALLEFSVSAFILGTLGFWLVTAVFVFVIALMLEVANKPKRGWSIFLIALYLVGMHFLGVKFLEVAKALTWVSMLTWTGYYLAGGMVWLVAKWWFFTWRWRQNYFERRMEFFETKGLPANTAKVPDELQTEWAEFCRGNYYRHSSFPNPPYFRQHLERLVDWGMLWPFSLIGTIFGDGLHWMWKQISVFLGKLLDRISKFQARGMDEDFVHVKEEAPAPEGRGRRTSRTGTWDD